MTTPISPAPDTHPSYGRRLQGGLAVFFRALLRLLIIVIAAAIIGLGIYTAVKLIYPRYIAPVQTNTQQLELLKQQLVDQDRQWTERTGQLQTRLAALESSQSLASETTSGLQTRLAEIDQLQQSSGVRLDQLNQIQSDLAALKTQINQSSQDAQSLDQRLSAADGPLAGLEREILLLKGMELLQRSRLSLVQNNAGLAKQDLLTLRNLIAALLDRATPEQKVTVNALQSRLDLALANLPAYPVLAAQDLEILWAQIGLGLPGDPAGLPTPASSTASDLSGLPPTPTPWLTPTPVAGADAALTPSPTPTPFTILRSSTPTAVPTSTP